MRSSKIYSSHDRGPSLRSTHNSNHYYWNSCVFVLVLDGPSLFEHENEYDHENEYEHEHEYELAIRRYFG
jgi:hypothetical protein